MPSSVQDAPSERRESDRASLYLAATLYCDGSPFPVKIRNISATGALIDSSTVPPAGALVQLVRGSLIVHALVAWSGTGRCGLRFSGTIDVQQWRTTPNNAEQQRVDDIVRLVKAGAVPLPVKAASLNLPDMERLSADLERASRLLEHLGDRLAKDGIVVAQYPAELQNLDIATQVVDAVRALLEAKDGSAIDAAKFASLRKSADQALSRPAA